MMERDLGSIVEHFHVRGRLMDVTPLTCGHINDTYVLRMQEDGCTTRYILQRINHRVFQDPPSLMHNVVRITEHIRRRMQQTDPAGAARQLTVIQTDDGTGFCRDLAGSFWRIYNFIEDAVTYDTAPSIELVQEAGRMFGWFQNMLLDLPGPVLSETIPNFHNTPLRLETFERVLKEDPCNRARKARAEIRFLLAHADICRVLLDLVDKGEMRLRIAHNDAKINNVMLDRTTHDGVCVIDLDTVMPGLPLYDFGDLVRTAACSAAEDERHLAKVTMDLSLFAALARGFLSEVNHFLTPAEREHLACASKLITFEQFIRFLTDYLAGDRYYKIYRERHNLDRARTQRKLVQSMIQQEEAMNELVAGILRDIA
jgi:hypothetical protein